MDNVTFFNYKHNLTEIDIGIQAGDSVGTIYEHNLVPYTARYIRIIATRNSLLKLNGGTPTSAQEQTIAVAFDLRLQTPSPKSTFMRSFDLEYQDLDGAVQSISGLNTDLSGVPDETIKELPMSSSFWAKGYLKLKYKMDYNYLKQRTFCFNGITAGGDNTCRTGTCDLTGDSTEQTAAIELENQQVSSGTLGSIKTDSSIDQLSFSGSCVGSQSQTPQQIGLNASSATSNCSYHTNMNTGCELKPDSFLTTPLTPGDSAEDCCNSPNTCSCFQAGDNDCIWTVEFDNQAYATISDIKFMGRTNYEMAHLHSDDNTIEINTQDQGWLDVGQTDWYSATGQPPMTQTYTDATFNPSGESWVGKIANGIRLINHVNNYEQMAFCGLQVLGMGTVCVDGVNTASGDSQWSADFKNGNQIAVEKVQIIGPDDNTNGLEIYIGGKLCAITFSQESGTLQEYKCNFMTGTKIEIKRSSGQHYTETRNIKLSGVRVFGKSNPTCDDYKPDYSSIGCEVYGRMDVEVTKKNIEQSTLYSYEKLAKIDFKRGSEFDILETYDRSIEEALQSCDNNANCEGIARKNDTYWNTWTKFNDQQKPGGSNITENSVDSYVKKRRQFTMTHLLSINITRNSDCFQLALQQGYKYAGIYRGNLCFGTNEEPLQEGRATCYNFQCPEPGEECGGYGTPTAKGNSVYLMPEYNQGVIVQGVSKWKQPDKCFSVPHLPNNSELTHQSTTTVTKLDDCVTQAVQQGTPYAAVMKDQCYTTNEILQSYDDAECSETCSAASSEECGSDPAGVATCVNNDTLTDSDGYTCSQIYDYYPKQFCGKYDTPQFISKDLCCACGKDNVNGNVGYTLKSVHIQNMHYVEKKSTTLELKSMLPLIESSHIYISKQLGSSFTFTPMLNITVAGKMQRNSNYFTPLLNPKIQLNLNQPSTNKLEFPSQDFIDSLNIISGGFKTSAFEYFYEMSPNPYEPLPDNTTFTFEIGPNKDLFEAQGQKLFTYNTFGQSPQYDIIVMNQTQIYEQFTIKPAYKCYNLTNSSLTPSLTYILNTKSQGQPLGQDCSTINQDQILADLKLRLGQNQACLGHTQTLKQMFYDCSTTWKNDVSGCTDVTPTSQLTIDRTHSSQFGICIPDSHTSSTNSIWMLYDTTSSSGQVSDFMFKIEYIHSKIILDQAAFQAQNITDITQAFQLLSPSSGQTPSVTLSTIQSLVTLEGLSPAVTAQNLIFKKLSSGQDATGLYDTYSSNELRITGQDIVFDPQSFVGQFQVYVVMGVVNGQPSIEYGIPIQATACGFKGGQVSINYIVGPGQGTSTDDLNLSQYIGTQSSLCKGATSRFTADINGTSISTSSAFRSITYDVNKQQITVNKDALSLGTETAFLEVKNTNGQVLTYLEFQATFETFTNQRPYFEKPFETPSVIVLEQDILDNKAGLFEYKSPKVIDPEGNSITMKFIQEDLIGKLSFIEKLDHFVARLDTSKVVSEDQGLHLFTIEVTDDGPEPRFPITKTFEIRISYEKVTNNDTAVKKVSSIDQLLSEMVDGSETTDVEEKEKVVNFVVNYVEHETEKVAQQEIEVYNDNQKAKGKDQVITEVQPVVTPSLKPGRVYASFDQMLDFEIEQNKLIKELQEQVKKEKPDDKDKETEPPKPLQMNIPGISSDGKVNMDFNQDVVVPPFAKQSSTTRRRLPDIDEIDVSFLFEVQFSPSSSIDPWDFKYYVYLLEWTEKKIDIKVEFEDPSIISSSPDFNDQFTLVPKQPNYFVSKKSGEAIDKDQQTFNQASVPPQLPEGMSEEEEQESAEQYNKSTMYIVIIQLVAQSVLKMGMNQLIVFYLDMQLTVYWTMYKANTPPNVVIFFEQLRNLINFEMLNADFILSFFVEDGLTVDKLIQRLRGRHTVISKNLESTGMKTGNILGNSSQLIVVAAGFIAFMIISALLILISRGTVREKLKQKFRDFNKKFWFNGMIESVTVSYLILSVGLCAQIIELQSSEEETTSGIYASIACVVFFLLGYIIAVTGYLFYFREELDHPSHRQIVENLYPNIEVRKLHNGFGYLYYPVFLLRRILFVAIPSIFFWRGGIQIMLLSFFNSLYLIWFAGIQPYNTRGMNRMSIFNLFGTMTLSYHMFIFTDFVIDSKTRFAMGYSFLVVMAIIAAVNLGLVGFNVSVKSIKMAKLTKIKKKKEQERNEIIQERKKALEKIIAERYIDSWKKKKAEVMEAYERKKRHEKGEFTSSSSGSSDSQSSSSGSDIEQQPDKKTGDFDKIVSENSPTLKESQEKKQREKIKSKASEKVVKAKAKVQRKRAMFSPKKELDTVMEASFSEASQRDSKTSRHSIKQITQEEIIPVKIKKSNKLNQALAVRDQEEFDQIQQDAKITEDAQGPQEVDLQQKQKPKRKTKGKKKKKAKKEIDLNIVHQDGDGPPQSEQ